ncbi:hypothetical protein B0A49_05727 [Cryomyces minteri]|uniref:Kynurenine formamidase n=1 Tax=Cryomyces minteri TaxID=331657 RepID=A0A4U0X711_9PEZI|nr:hypothetical protein B0A49_05727 [Cryomyces minteri]
MTGDFASVTTEFQMSAMSDDYPRFINGEAYSEDSSLNTLDICLLRPSSEDTVWIIFIHGGAYRDPLISKASFLPTQSLLLSSKAPFTSHIAGLASPNYRLSPYPSHSTHPSAPSDTARNAKHPDHISDVLRAIAHLQRRFRFGERYILVGHSCGATMALQVAMSRDWGSGLPASSSRSITNTTPSHPTAVPPLGIVGLEVIYSIPLMLHNHASTPAYRDFILNAFGPDIAIPTATSTTVSTSINTDADTYTDVPFPSPSPATLYQDVSPTSAHFTTSWPKGRVVVLAHSKDDELVEWGQVEAMKKVLLAQSWAEDAEEGGREVHVLEIVGSHDGVWRDGKEVVRAVGVALGKIFGGGEGVEVVDRRFCAVGS